MINAELEKIVGAVGRLVEVWIAARKIAKDVFDVAVDGRNEINDLRGLGRLAPGPANLAAPQASLGQQDLTVFLHA